MTSARNLILKNIGLALAQTPAAPADHSQENGLAAGEDFSREQLKTMFAHRWQAVGGQYHLAGDQARAEEIISQALAQFKGREVALAPSALELMPDLDKLLAEMGLNVGDPFPDRAAGSAAGITGASLALAYSGSLVVNSGQAGSLSASLLPPVHLALVPSSCLVHGLAGAIDRINRAGWPRAAVFITGPSRTADIELTLVKGVHGPEKTLAILLDYGSFKSTDQACDPGL